MSVARVLGAASLLCIVSAASAAISFTGSYSENFDSIGPTGTTPPADWTPGDLVADPIVGGGGAIVNVLALTVDDGNSVSTTRSYNYGTTSDSDRAIGSIPSTGHTMVLQAAFTNSTGGPISSMNIGYTLEQWHFGQASGSRTGDKTERLLLFYSTAPDSGWVSVNLDGAAPRNFHDTEFPTDNFPVNGNLDQNRTVLSTTFSLPSPLPDSAAFYLRWVDVNDVNLDHGLAVDNVTLAVPEPASLSPMGVAGLLLGRRRSRQSQLTN